jgi:hypothetical protein
MIQKVMQTVRSGGLGYFLGSILVVIVSLLVNYFIYLVHSPFLSSFSWFLATISSIIVLFPFLVWFTNISFKWGWNFELLNTWTGIKIAACWSVLGSLVGFLFCYVVYLIL